MNQSVLPLSSRAAYLRARGHGAGHRLRAITRWSRGRAVHFFAQHHGNEETKGPTLKYKHKPATRGADLQGVLDGEVDRGDEGHAGLRAGLAALDTRWVGLQCQGAQTITTRGLGLARHQTQRGTSVLFSFELKVLSFGGFGPSHCFLGEGCARALLKNS